AAAQAHPAHLVEQLAEAFLDVPEQPVEQLEILVLAVVVDHEAVEAVDHFRHRARVVLAEPAERPGRIGDVEARSADLWIEPQAAGDARGLLGEPRELADAVEDDLVGERYRFVDLAIRPRDAVRLRLAAEMLVT